MPGYRRCLAWRDLFVRQGAPCGKFGLLAGITGKGCRSADGEIGETQPPQTEGNVRIGLQITDQGGLIAQAQRRVVTPHQPRPGITTGKEIGGTELIARSGLLDIVGNQGIGCPGGERRQRQQGGAEGEGTHQIRPLLVASTDGAAGVALPTSSGCCL